MKIKSMLKFTSCEQFKSFVEAIDKMNWKIEKQLLKERVEKYGQTYIFQMLKKQFYQENISIWPLKDEEVITWIDTLTILRRTIEQIEVRGVQLDKLSIIMEYPLVFGNHMRTDYLLVYDRLIIVLEFGMFNQDEKRSEERYTKKLQDSINHRQVLVNMIDSRVKVINYVLVYRPEVDRMKSLIMSENINYNNCEIGLLSDFIIKNIIEQNSVSAISQLQIINNFT
ncbi:MAG: hypothetical protein C4537_05945 [Acholeplasma sp.]|jgi:hypothetical protein|nr:MAG: hypothetical protein C4537_05945 [Acholeplasma sp.]